MEKTLDVIYAVKLKFVGEGPVWMHFGGGRASKVNFEAEFVGINAVWKWLTETMANNAFVVAMNDTTNEAALVEWIEDLDALRENDGGTLGALATSIGLFGKEIISVDGELTELLIEITPVSICTYRHFDNPIRAKFWLQDTRQEDSVVLVDDGITGLYDRSKTAFGEPFTNALFVQLETALQTKELDDLRLEYGQWVITFEVGTEGTDFAEIPALRVNPKLVEYRIQVTDEAEAPNVSIRLFTVINHGVGLTESILEDEGVAMQIWYWAMVEFHRNNNPFMQLLTPIEAFGDGEYTVEVLDVEIQ